jgi:hypothetical protein
MLLPDALLTRDQTAAALTEAGYPVRPKTLATKATRGGGPPYRLFGTRPLYRWSEALDWAESRTGLPRASTSEGDALWIAERLTGRIPAVGGQK